MRSLFNIIRKKRSIWLLLSVGFLIWYYSILPDDLFDEPTSTLIEDSSGGLMGARIAEDEQWRFPQLDTLPYKFRRSIIQFEDRYFHYHPGVNPFSLLRAMYQDVKAGEIVSGGSTISMQVIRLSRKDRPRTIWEKVIECVLATRLEFSFSKEEILRMYASHAPFGGNVVGLGAASWRYFEKPPDRLSWGEAATLAVLPNAPALVRPGKNDTILERKRDRLLKGLHQSGVIDSATMVLAQSESLPGDPKSLPNVAPRAMDQLALQYRGKRVRTTIHRDHQDAVRRVVEQHSQVMEGNGVHNMGVMVMEVESGDVTAYLGNTRGNKHGNKVDMITSERSSGSILKPFLYGAMLDDGKILPSTMVKDIPTSYSGFSPRNYNKKFHGAVPADEALARSLNVPAVRMLDRYGTARFHDLLGRAGFTTINRPPGHYGLSLILGGAETKLWDLVSIYGGMARSLVHYQEIDEKSPPFRGPNLLEKKVAPKDREHLPSNGLPISEGAVWKTFQALLNVERPANERGWNTFRSAGKVAYKTGTSYGNRDAWAVGVTPEHVVGVWVGNADGEGRPGLTGIDAAAPVLFDVFGYLGTKGWFDPPHDELKKVRICKKSGHPPNGVCPNTKLITTPDVTMGMAPCPYHKKVHLGPDERYRVDTRCFNTGRIHSKPWFVLPPGIEYYYKHHNSKYKALPPYHPGCGPVEESQGFALISPESQGSEHLIPIEMGGEQGRVVFEAVHRSDQASLHWHLDRKYLGSTKRIHQMALSPDPGEHELTLVDEEGNSLVHRFKVLRRN